MKLFTKRVGLSLSALTTFAVTASVIGATGAFAISPVVCGPSDYLHIQAHGSGWGGDACYANAGQISYSNGSWLTYISTGNNLVQWYGDGRWQPATPIPKNTVYTFPNNPGGVSFTAIKIL